MREDGDNKPYQVRINIEWVLEALDWLIEHNVLYQDLKDTNWRNEDAIKDYSTEATFTIQQHVSSTPKRVAPAWRDDSKAEDWAGEINLGRTQPGLDHKYFTHCYAWNHLRFDIDVKCVVFNTTLISFSMYYYTG